MAPYHTSMRLVRRIFIPTTATSPPGQVQANTIDPWVDSGKYGLGWTYFAIVLTALAVLVRLWHFWQDKIRQAIYKHQVEEYYRSAWDADFLTATASKATAAHATTAEDATNDTTANADLRPPALYPDTALRTGDAGRTFFPDGEGLGDKEFRPQAHFSSVGFVNDGLALFRWIFYRPLPDLAWGRRRFTFSSLAVLALVAVAVIFVSLFTFLLQPLYWESIQYGSPPVAVRAGMIAVALTPWIIATSTKTNLLTMLTGIGPERLNVFHRWLGYLCLFLSLVHTVPFYVQPVWDDGGADVFQRLFPGGNGVIYGTGIACLVPLAWLCLGSLPVIRRVAYELFVVLHVPVGAVYVALLFWHTKNYLMSWGYLWASLAVWAACYLLRLFNLNWVRPGRLSFLVGDEAAISLMSDNCIKITVPTQMRWRPGQYVYLRMPGISVFENHPFTISSLCSEDFPSEYGEQYRDCVLVFRPYGGFTRRVLETAIQKGPFHTYRAFLDGPYGGMTRDLAAFDTCILIAGGSGITALMSQLLNLIKRMRDGKAITRRVVVVWALKRLEAMDWFREELRICRDSAPPESVTCKFFVTSAVRNRSAPGSAGNGNGNGAGEDAGGFTTIGRAAPPQAGARALTHAFHDKLDGFVAGIASKRNSALIHAEAQGDLGKERELRAEDEDRITALPQSFFFSQTQQAQLQTPSHLQTPTHPRAQTHPHAQTHRPPPDPSFGWPEDPSDPADKTTEPDAQHAPKRKSSFHFPPLEKPEPPHFNLAPPQPFPRKAEPVRAAAGDEQFPIRVPELTHLRTSLGSATLRPSRPVSVMGPPAGFDFGFPETPTEFQKSLMRFAFPVPHEIDGGWSMEYGRPDLGYMLREWATGGADGRGILGRRTAVFVCGPPAMRVGVANTVAHLQAEIWGDDMLEEIFLHTENYAL